jgi:hypothetical protein
MIQEYSRTLESRVTSAHQEFVALLPDVFSPYDPQIRAPMQLLTTCTDLSRLQTEYRNKVAEELRRKK